MRGFSETGLGDGAGLADVWGFEDNVELLGSSLRLLIFRFRGLSSITFPLPIVTLRASEGNYSKANGKTARLNQLAVCVAQILSYLNSSVIFFTIICLFIYI